MRDLKKRIKEILGLNDDFLFPSSIMKGKECLYILKEGSLLSGEVAVSSMGKIWSNQGLYPAVKDVSSSIFYETPFLWFCGLSSTAHADYIYYLDQRGSVKVYFRGEYGFFGEDRKKEVARFFSLIQNIVRQMKEEERCGEVVFHVREGVVRIKKGDTYCNFPIIYD